MSGCLLVGQTLPVLLSYRETERKTIHHPSPERFRSGDKRGTAAPRETIPQTIPRRAVTDGREMIPLFFL